MSNTLSLTAQIVAAHVTNNGIEAERLPELIRSVFQALTAAGQPQPEARAKEPAVPVKKSVFDDYIVCLECGKDFRTLNRHLRVEHSLTKDEYRERFALPHDYPLVAPEYSEARAAVAKTIGLGRKPGFKRGKKRA